MTGRQVLSLLAEIARDEANRIRQSQEALITAGHRADWAADRARAHHGLSAMADVVERLVLSATDAIDNHKSPPKRTLDCADIGRSALIVEITRLTTTTSMEEPDGPHEAAA